MIQLEPIYKKKVWGGRKLNSLYGRVLPYSEDVPIGEAWDIVDRPYDQSIVSYGDYEGLTLHDLWTNHHDEVFGYNAPDADRFPILCKILDAQENLSLQVHPPHGVAERLEGEPKSEFWYAAQAEPYSLWFGGIIDQLNPDLFKATCRAGNALGLIQPRIIMQGDSWFLPSGTVHGLGENQVIFEIQENSDTTYRVYDWERTDRELHIDKAAECIDFTTNFRPEILVPDQNYCLVNSDIFQIHEYRLSAIEDLELDFYNFTIIAVTEGEVECNGVTVTAGHYFMLAACDENKTVSTTKEGTRILSVTWPTK